MEKYVFVVEMINNFIGRGRHPYFVDGGYIRQHLFKVRNLSSVHRSINNQPNLR
jgi:hypothetical protein